MVTRTKAKPKPKAVNGEALPDAIEAAPEKLAKIRTLSRIAAQKELAWGMRRDEAKAAKDEYDAAIAKLRAEIDGSEQGELFHSDTPDAPPRRGRSIAKDDAALHSALASARKADAESEARRAAGEDDA